MRYTIIIIKLTRAARVSQARGAAPIKTSGGFRAGGLPRGAPVRQQCSPLAG